MNKDLKKLQMKSKSERDRLKRVMKFKYFRKHHGGKLMRFTTTMFAAPFLIGVMPVAYLTHSVSAYVVGTVICGAFAYVQRNRRIRKMYLTRSKNKSWVLKYNQEVNYMMLKALHLNSISKETYDLFYTGKGKSLNFDNYLTRAEKLTSEQKKSLNDIIVKNKAKNLNKVK